MSRLNQRVIRNYGATVQFDTSGLQDIEKKLFAVEPALINAQFEAAKEAAKKIVELIRSYIPSAFEVLKNSIIGRVRTYQQQRIIFITVGSGSEVAFPRAWSSRAKTDVTRWSRWQEHGYEPLRWESEKKWRGKKKSFKKKGFTDRSSPEWEGLRLKFEAESKRLTMEWKADGSYRSRTDGTTKPKHFVGQSKAEARRLEEQALEDAITKVTEQFESGELERMFNVLENQGNKFLDAIHKEERDEFVI